MESCEKLTANERIQEALVECLKEKIKIEDLTVAFLAKKAGVGKSTFYRYYKDIYDVYEQLVESFMGRCEKLIRRVFFENTLTVEKAIWIVMKSGLKKDNELFYARDAILINYSIEFSNGKIVELLYDKAYDYVLKISKIIGADDESAHFGATFFLNGNIMPILSVLHSKDKLSLGTVILTTEIFEKEVEKWKQQQNQ